MSELGHVWTAPPWQELSDVFAALVVCGHVSGLFVREVCLSPNAGGEPPSDPRGVIRIARKLYLKNSILGDSAIEQKRQAEDHNERGREPRSERESACRYD